MDKRQSTYPKSSDADDEHDDIFECEEEIRILRQANANTQHQIWNLKKDVEAEYEHEIKMLHESNQTNDALVDEQKKIKSKYQFMMNKKNAVQRKSIVEHSKYTELKHEFDKLLRASERDKVAMQKLKKENARLRQVVKGLKNNV